MRINQKYSTIHSLFVLLIGGLGILISSCGKTAVTPTPVKGTDTTKTPTGTTQDVYMAGTVNNKATVWKNGVATTLAGGATRTYGNAIYVNGTDVYVAGYGTDQNNANGVALVWKNGVVSTLQASPNAKANAIYVSAAGVYVAGTTTVVYQNNQPYPNNGTLSYQAATVWINGVAKVLSDGNKAFYDNNGLLGLGIVLDRDSQANGIYANGSDVYVAGNENQGAYGEINATLWKNQNKLILYNNIGGDYTANAPQGGFIGKFFSGDTSYIIAPTFSLSSSNNASSVFVSNGIVYTAGFVTQGEQNAGVQVSEPHKATVWKNGVAKALGDSTLYGNPNGLYVNGNDVYAVGYTLKTGATTATVWKNGTATDLTTSGSGAIAKSVFVSGTNVYIAGNVSAGSAFQGVLWKNGVASYFTDATGTTTIAGVFVK